MAESSSSPDTKRSKKPAREATEEENASDHSLDIELSFDSKNTHDYDALQQQNGDRKKRSQEHVQKLMDLYDDMGREFEMMVHNKHKLKKGVRSLVQALKQSTADYKQNLTEFHQLQNKMESAYMTAKENELKFDVLMVALLKCLKQCTGAYKDKLDTLAEIIVARKEECQESDSEQEDGQSGSSHGTDGK